MQTAPSSDDKSKPRPSDLRLASHFALAALNLQRELCIPLSEDPHLSGLAIAAERANFRVAEACLERLPPLANAPSQKSVQRAVRARTALHYVEASILLLRSARRELCNEPELGESVAVVEGLLYELLDECLAAMPKPVRLRESLIV